MLVGLNINNVALIESVDMELREGLNVLTGETGAGKSIIIDSINAVLGERLSKDLIRTGTEKAVVEAVFIVDNDKLSGVFESMGITPEDDGTLVVSREYSISGRNICRINGRAATVTMLKELGEHLIDIHGQYDNQSLLKVDRHIELLDLFSGDAVKNLKREYANCLEEYRSIRNKMAERMGDRNERERRLDLLRYQINEIENARLKPGEDESLEKQRVILSSTEKIIDALNDSYDLLYAGGDVKNSALDSINRAISEINGISRIDEKYMSISKRLEEISYLLDDVSEEIRKEKDGMELSPGILEQIEERLDAIYRLKRKYGSSIDEILKYRDKISSELEEMENSEELAAKLTQMLKKNELELYDMAKKLHEERSKACEILENGISLELDDLEMKKAGFKVSMEFDDTVDSQGQRKYTINGLSRVEFLISPNAGEPLKPLSKIASGGEMSRVMLAIKTVLAGVDRMPTLIFDEIDTGISGRAARKVGEKLSIISRNHQVICITHLAQIASMADWHYLIEKVTEKDRTSTKIHKLSGKEVSKEIARILDGSDASDITLKHAEEMLSSALEFKKLN